MALSKEDKIGGAAVIRTKTKNETIDTVNKQTNKQTQKLNKQQTMALWKEDKIGEAAVIRTKTKQ